MVGAGVGAGIGCYIGGAKGAVKGFSYGSIIGGVSGAVVAGGNIASGSVEIVGAAQKTGTAFHAEASNLEDGKMLLHPGKFSKITFDRALKTAGLKGSQRPDVIGVARYGKNRLVEVVSKSQTRKQMKAKCKNMIRHNPRSGYRVVNWPAVFSKMKKRLLQSIKTKR
ncbi:MAG: hypothetical protein MJ092_08570 [Lachnospiraceae bacterium]|nr:hypothetical protein [Lachnospiraceae bacterium]